MTKQEIFDKILEICAEVCKVNKKDIINARRQEDVCTARALLVFWTDAAGFSGESMIKLCECKNANSINSVRLRIEPLWNDKYAFHLLVADVGRKLLKYAHSINEDFDMWKPIRKIARSTGKYMPHEE